jgi:Ca-activated chloride channel family protein
VLAKVRIEAEGVETSDLEPSAVPDLFASRPLVVCGRWNGEPRGTIVVRGIAGNGAPFEKRIDLAEAARATGTDHPALPVLWARERVRSLEEGPVNEANTASIVSLGLKHSLLTRHTSFVAVDDTPRETTTAARTVRQPLPLPQGVTEAAVGTHAAGGTVVAGGSVPEPGAIGLIALLVVLLALQRNRSQETAAP